MDPFLVVLLLVLAAGGAFLVGVGFSERANLVPIRAIADWVGMEVEDADTDISALVRMRGFLQGLDDAAACRATETAIAPEDAAPVVVSVNGFKVGELTIAVPKSGPTRVAVTVAPKDHSPQTAVMGFSENGDEPT